MRIETLSTRSPRKRDCMTLRLLKAKLKLHPLSVAQKPGYCTMLAAAWTELAELSSAVVEADLASAD